MNTNVSIFKKQHYKMMNQKPGNFKVKGLGRIGKNLTGVKEFNLYLDDPKQYIDTVQKLAKEAGIEEFEFFIESI